MKTMLTVLFWIASCQILWAANPTLVVETFDRAYSANGSGTGAGNGWTVLDGNPASYSETVRKCLNTTAGLEYHGTGFIWGGYNPSATQSVALTQSASDNGPQDSLIFNQGALRNGGRAYTRFDTSALSLPESVGTRRFNTSSFTLDCSDPQAKCILEYNTQGEPALQVALLLRDDIGWWESDAVASAQNVSKLEIALSTRTWTQIDISSGTYGADMDEVDNGGEGMLTYLSSGGSPHLDQIKGMGVIIKNPATASATNMAISTMVLGKLPDPPATITATIPTGATAVSLDWASVTGALGYNVYRAMASGGPYTQLNTAPIASTHYDDASATNNTPYYYAVSTVVNAGYGIESPLSNETAVLTPVAGSPSRHPSSGVFAIWISNRTYLQDLPYISGGQAVVQWKDVETTHGVYNFNALDSQLQALQKKGLATTVQLNGNLKPAYLFESIPHHPTQLNQVNDPLGTLMYWHPIHKQSYLNLVAAFAQHVRRSPYRSSIIGVRLNYDMIGTELSTIPSGMRNLSEGWIIPSGADATTLWPWNSSYVSDYENAVVQQFVTQFLPDVCVLCRTSSGDTALGLYPAKFNTGELGWFTTGDIAEPSAWAVAGQLTFLEYCRSGKTIGYSEPYADGWGFHGGNQDTYWCSPPQNNYWRILLALHQGISFIACYGDDLRIAADGYYPDNRPAQPWPVGNVPQYQGEFTAAFQFGAKYAGYHDQPVTSPGAWIAFRQGMRLPGDYSFLMTRLPDHTTATADQTSIGPNDSRFGAFARILPQGKSMNLLLNTAFVSSLSGRNVPINITYLDQGTGSFSLSVGGKLYEIPKQDSQTWKTFTATVQASDLVLNSVGAHIALTSTSGQTVFHMVEVQRGSISSSARQWQNY